MAVISLSREPKLRHPASAGYRKRQSLLIEEKDRLDKAAARLIREGLDNMSAIYLEVFGKSFLDPIITDALNARVLEFRAYPSKMPDCEQ